MKMRNIAFADGIQCKKVTLFWTFTMSKIRGKKQQPTKLFSVVKLWRNSNKNWKKKIMIASSVRKMW